MGGKRHPLMLSVIGCLCCWLSDCAKPRRQLRCHPSTRREEMAWETEEDRFGSLGSLNGFCFPPTDLICPFLQCVPWRFVLRCCSSQVAGYGATCDAHHITAPAPDGNGLARAIGAAMKMGGITPEVCHCLAALNHCQGRCHRQGWCHPRRISCRIAEASFASESYRKDWKMWSSN